MKKPPSLNSILRHAAFGCLSLLMFGCDSSEQHPAAQPSDETSTKSRGPTSVEDVQRAVVGTWTYTGQDYDMMGQKIWEKWVFKPDGTMESYTAMPADDNWGKAEIKKWQAVTAKYSDTGERWYGITVEDWLRPVILKDNGKLRFHPADDVDVEFTKGDKSPFSK